MLTSLYNVRGPGRDGRRALFCAPLMTVKAVSRFASNAKQTFTHAPPRRKDTPPSSPLDKSAFLGLGVDLGAASVLINARPPLVSCPLASAPGTAGLGLEHSTSRQRSVKTVVTELTREG